MKKSLLWIIVVLMSISMIAVFSLAGCKGEEAAAEEVAEEEITEEEVAEEEVVAEPVNLQIWSTPQWMGVYNDAEPAADYGDFFRFVAEEYEKENPNVDIEFQNLTGAERTEKLNINIAAGTPPDIFFDASFVLTDFAHRGALIPLDDIITTEDTDDIPQSAWDLVTIGGNIWGYPFAVNPGYLIINTDLFEEAGAYIPEGDVGIWESTEQFKESLEAVSNLKGVSPLALYCGSDQGDTQNNMYLRMFGADFYNEEGTEVIINSPEGVEALEFLLELRDEGLTNIGVETAIVMDALNLFYNKQAAAGFSNSANERNLLKGLEDGTYEKPFNYKMTYFPGPQPMMYMYMPISIAFDTGDEARMEASKDFIRFYSSQEPYVFASGNFVPVRKSVATEIADIDYVNSLSSSEAYVESLENAIDFTGRVPGYLQLRSIFFPELQAAFTGEKTAQEALDDFATNANEILSQNVEASALLQ